MINKNPQLGDLVRYNDDCTTSIGVITETTYDQKMEFIIIEWMDDKLKNDEVETLWTREDFGMFEDYCLEVLAT